MGDRIMNKNECVDKLAASFNLVAALAITLMPLHEPNQLNPAEIITSQENHEVQSSSAFQCKTEGRVARYEILKDRQVLMTFIDDGVEETVKTNDTQVSEFDGKKLAKLWCDQNLDVPKYMKNGANEPNYQVKGRVQKPSSAIRMLSSLLP